MNERTNGGRIEGRNKIMYNGHTNGRVMKKGINQEPANECTKLTWNQK